MQPNVQRVSLANKQIEEAHMLMKMGLTKKEQEKKENIIQLIGILGQDGIRAPSQMNQTLTTDHFRSTVNKIQEQEPHIGVKLDPQAQMELSMSESFGKSTFGKRSGY